MFDFEKHFLKQRLTANVKYFAISTKHSSDLFVLVRLLTLPSYQTTDYLLMCGIINDRNALLSLN